MTTRINIFPVLAAVLLLLGFSQAWADSASLSAPQEDRIREIVADTLRQKPELVLEALKTLEERQKAAEEAKIQEQLSVNEKSLFQHPDDPVGGNPNGDVTLVEFFDYRCPYCKKVHPDVMALLREDGNIRFVYKEFPILGPQSDMAAQTALASQVLEKYQQFNDALMTARGSFSPDHIFGIAEKTGMDVKALQRAMEASKDKNDKIIRRNLELAARLNITGTPAFVIGGQVIRGAVDLETLKLLVSEARAKKKES